MSNRDSVNEPFYGIYHLAGLTAVSDMNLPIPQSVCTTRPDLRYVVASHSVPSMESVVSELESKGGLVCSRIPQFGFVAYELAGSTYLIWPNLGFRVAPSEDEVKVLWADPEFLPMARWPLLGPVLGFVLHQRGRLCLHASVIEKSDRCIAFLGTHRRGKSTLTATLVAQGWRLVSDDLLCITNPQSRRLKPCFPFLKLNPDSLGHLRLSHIAGYSIPGTDKIAVPLDGWGCFTSSAELTLDVIYVIRRCNAEHAPHRSTISARNLDRSLAKACLVSNGYAAKFLSPLQRFSFCDSIVQFASRLPVRELALPWGFDHLAGLPYLLDNDLSRL